MATVEDILGHSGTPDSLVELKTPLESHETTHLDQSVVLPSFSKSELPKTPELPSSDYIASPNCTPATFASPSSFRVNQQSHEDISDSPLIGDIRPISIRDAPISPLSGTQSGSMSHRLAKSSIGDLDETLDDEGDDTLDLLQEARRALGM